MTARYSPSRASGPSSRATEALKAGPWPAPRLWFPDDGAERRRGADPSQGDARDLDDGRGARRLDAGVMG
jgi:hypothetical protein